MLGAYGTPILGEGEVVGAQRWHHSKKRWRFPIGSPLWPLRYMWPFGRNLQSNVSDTQINRGVGDFAPQFRVFPLEQTRHVGVAQSEHSRLTTGGIIFEEFQSMWSQFTNVTDGRTDRQTDDMRRCDRSKALCTKVHRAVKTIHFLYCAFCSFKRVGRITYCVYADVKPCSINRGFKTWIPAVLASISSYCTVIYLYNECTCTLHISNFV